MTTDIVNPDAEGFRTPNQKKKAARLDLAALHYAQMKRGTYERDGYKQRYSADGSPSASILEALRSVQFGETYKELQSQCQHGTGRWGEYFQKRVSFHMARMAGGYRKELAELTNNGVDLFKLRVAAFDSLLYDLENDACSIPFKDRAKLYVDVTRLEAEVKGDDSTVGLKGTVMNTIVNNFGNPVQAQRFLDKIAEKTAAYEMQAEDILVVGEVDEQ